MRRPRSHSCSELFLRRCRPKMDTDHVSFIDSDNHQDQNNETSPHLEATVNDASADALHAQEGREDYSPLHLAVFLKDRIRFRAMLPCTKDLNVHTRDGMTPLLTAAKNSMADMAVDLLSAGADIHATDLTGRTALHWASLNGCIDLVVALLPYRPNLNSRDSHGLTPLHCARADIARCLLKAGADANLQDNFGFTPLHLSVMGSNPIFFRILLCRTKPLDTHCKYEHMTPLITAIVKDAMPDMVYDLIKAGADVNLPSREGKTALHWAAYFSNLPNREDAAARRANIAKMLLDAGADANIYNSDGDTPLHVAANTKAWPVFYELLRHKGTNLDAPNAKSKTVLMGIMSESETSAEALKAFESLLQAGASIHARDNEQKTALHIAALLDKYDELNLLIKYGADVNAVDLRKTTPLHVAGLVRILGSSEEPAQNSVVDGYGETPVDHNKTKIVKSLLDAGADPDARDLDGITPLYLSVIRKDANVFRVLLDRVSNWSNHATYVGGVAKGMTPLLVAADLGMADMVFELLKSSRTNRSARTRDGSTALHFAANFNKIYKGGNYDNITATGKARAARILLRCGADPNARDHSGDTVLHTAVKTMAWPVLRELLDEGRVVVNARNKYDGKTALMMVLERPASFQIFLDLIEAGAFLHATDNKGSTPLHYATKLNKCDELNELVRRGADVNATDETGNTPLFIAAELGLQQAYNILNFAYGLDVNVRRSSDGKTLLMVLLESDLPVDEFACAMERIADIHAKDAEDKSAVHYAAEYDKPVELSMLLERGGKVDERDCFGRTPLYFAALEGNYESCELLMRLHYADRDIPDVRGYRPIDVAEEKDYEVIVMLLDESPPAG